MRRFCPHMRFGVTFVAVFMFEAEHVSRSKTNSPPICVPKPGRRQRPQRVFRIVTTFGGKGVALMGDSVR